MDENRQRLVNAAKIVGAFTHCFQGGYLFECKSADGCNYMFRHKIARPIEPHNVVAIHFYPGDQDEYESRVRELSQAIEKATGRAPGLVDIEFEALIASAAKVLTAFDATDSAVTLEAWLRALLTDTQDQCECDFTELATEIRHLSELYFKFGGDPRSLVGFK